MKSDLESVEMAEFYDHVFRRKPGKWSTPERDMFMVKVINDFLAAGFRKPPKRILDAGCGNGHTLAACADAWPTARLHGLDVSGVAIQLAQHAVPEAEFTQGMIGRVKIGKKFDLIVSLGVVEHLAVPENGLRWMRDLLTPGGILYLEVPHNLAYTFSEKQEGFRQLNGGSRQMEWHLRRTSWEAILERSGLNVCDALVGTLPSWEFCWILEAAE